MAFSSSIKVWHFSFNTLTASTNRTEDGRAPTDSIVTEIQKLQWVWANFLVKTVNFERKYLQIKWSGILPNLTLSFKSSCRNTFLEQLSYLAFFTFASTMPFETSANSITPGLKQLLNLSAISPFTGFVIWISGKSLYVAVAESKMGSGKLKCIIHIWEWEKKKYTLNWITYRLEKILHDLYRYPWPHA